MMMLTDRQEEITPDEPPSYEAPPDYEEVIKIGMDNEMREPRDRQHQRTRKHHRRRRDRSCSRNDSNATVSSTVPIHNFSDMPSTSAAAAVAALTTENYNPRPAPETLTELDGAGATASAVVAAVPDLAQQVARATQNCGNYQDM